ncbi:hypothetical protein DSCA_63000 [Desulfosarcina alkanivorans]|uniref:Uncharacterized protein n=1 Tax=Desulfosarcina alkanivorans TaxID=571177 RepID=A0A5K7YVL6_9BACT|nr:hypothetical protein [Desulfosarcina alkanivorans]BBO72370.1 hypothetical protein DSCA_63000 [Desulfosarcina alkanivorans]
MKTNGGVWFISLFALFCVLIQSGTGHAYEISWSVIQHRVYESQAPVNRLVFEILDSGNYVDDINAVSGVVLKYPNGSEVDLSNFKFTPILDYYSAKFDRNADRYQFEWIFYPVRELSEFKADIESPLVTGTYTLDVSMANGEVLTTPVDFEILLDLPVISSRTFRI